MALFENFPFTNLHQLNLDWLIEEVKKCYSPDNPPEAMVISVNGESGEVILYKNAHVALPDITDEQWNIYRGSANKITGIEFNKDNPATRINGNQRFVIYDAGNPPPYPVIAVNGETGNVILYEEPYAVFPDVEGDNWGLERKLNTDTADETRVGIMFDDAGKAYITHDEDATQLLTIEDIPSSSGVVSINGNTGIVNLDGSNLLTSPNSGKTINQALTENSTGINTNTEDIDALETTVGKIKNSLAFTENGNTASHNIPKNSYVLWNNEPYIATSNISNGATLSTSVLRSIDNGFVNDVVKVETKPVTIYDNRVSLDQIDTPNVIKYGHVCCVSGVVTFLMTPTTQQTSILVLPSDIPPIKNFYTTCFRLSDGKVLPLQVSTTGNINIINRGEVNTGDSFYIGITYIT